MMKMMIDVTKKVVSKGDLNGKQSSAVHPLGEQSEQRFAKKVAFIQNSNILKE